ncbi:hypothetical protein ACIA8O_06010 [Kitasatospora sp. NPDC051853]|uniref:hypothetical protein n=1 Tax=Kitasatospora sp. NPDC051853 TaxID=3364058 RepID=UPI0037A2B8AE
MTRTVAALTAAAAALLLTACTADPPEGDPGRASAPVRMPAEGQDVAAEFTAHVARSGTPAQRREVVGHITRATRGVPQGGHTNSYLATDHEGTDAERNELIIRAYLDWAGESERGAMLVVYRKDGAVMAAADLPSWQGR